jgi:DNA repair protein RadC
VRDLFRGTIDGAGVHPREVVNLVRFRAISGSQERHIGSHIVEFYNVKDGLA